MKHFQLSVIALAVAISAGCGKVKKTENKKGEPISGQKAVNLLISASRWCYRDTNNDKIFGTHVFLNAGSGEYAVYDGNTHTYQFADPMTWNVSGDILTMKMPKNEIWERQMRAITDGEQTTLIFITEGETQRAMLSPCNL